MSSEYDPKSEPQPKWFEQPADPLGGFSLEDIFDAIDGKPSQQDENPVVERSQEPPPPEPRKFYERSGDWHAPLEDPLPNGQELDAAIAELFEPTTLETGRHMLPIVAKQIFQASKQKNKQRPSNVSTPSEAELQYNLDQIALSAVRLDIMNRDLSFGEAAYDEYAWEMLADHHGKWGMIMVLTQLLHLEQEIQAGANWCLRPVCESAQIAT